MKIAHGGALSLAALALVACAATSRLPVGADEAQVRAAMGEPKLALPDPHGGKHLVYPRGPGGAETHIARLGPDGKLVAVEQVLDETHFAKIRRGETTEAELLRLIGPPWQRIEFANLGQVAWDYRFRDTWGYLADLSVMVDRRGVVASTVVVRIDPRSASGRD
jgi:outer membrane protein assembly factor BamE (lipoprotein component of BamABCDE complex)